MDNFTLCVLIFMLVIGPAVGNYACSVVYRLPRGQTPFERHPFCGSCNAALQPVDLMPILSWLRTRGKCRYCGAPVPIIYLFIELACLAIFAGYFLHFGMNEHFLLYAAYGAFVVILAAIDWQQGWISSSIYGYAITCILLARALSEHSIYPTFFNALTMLIIMLGLMKLARNKADPFTKTWVWWFVLLGTVTPMHYWKYLAALYLFKLIVPKKYRVLVYSAAALVLPVLVA